MADAHGHTPDPNTAPMHSDVKDDFSPTDVTIAIILGLFAIAAGIVGGILFVNS